MIDAGYHAWCARRILRVVAHVTDVCVETDDIPVFVFIPARWVMYDGILSRIS